MNIQLVQGGLNAYSIFNDVPIKNKQMLLYSISTGNEISKAVGSIVGMAIGDYVGAPLENLSADEDAENLDIVRMHYKKMFNKYKLLVGQWTDDTSTALCVADSLIELQAFDASDIRIRLWNWWFNGYNNTFRFDNRFSKSIGLEGSTMKSITELTPGEIPEPEFATDAELPFHGADSGSLSRIAPIAVFYSQNPKLAVKYAMELSYATHTSKVAADAAGFIAYLIVSGITNTSFTTIKSFLTRHAKEYLSKAKTTPLKRLLIGQENPKSPELCWNWRSERLYLDRTFDNRGDQYLNCKNIRGYLGYYSLDALALALHALYNSNSFETAIEKAVNTLGLSSTIGTITGQIAGAFYGYENIDVKLINVLNKWDAGEIALRGVMLYNYSCT